METTVTNKLQVQSNLLSLGSIRYRLSHWFVLTLLLIASIVLLSPLAYTISTSLRSPSQSFTLPPQWLPIHPDFTNYRQVFEIIPFAIHATNSVVVTLTIIVGQVVTASLAGYAFARFNFPGKNILFWLVMATMMIPLQATIIPVFVLISKLGLGNTLLSLILPAFPTAFGTFLMRQYFLTMPNDFEEAALIDGANQWQIFSKVYLPLAAPGLAVLAILAFNFHWNEFFRPVIFLSSQNKFTMPLALVNLQGYMGTGSISVVLAGVVLSLIPVLVIFLFGQRYLIEGMMKGGIKG